MAKKKQNKKQKNKGKPNSPIQKQIYHRWRNESIGPAKSDIHLLLDEWKNDLSQPTIFSRWDNDMVGTRITQRSPRSASKKKKKKQKKNSKNTIYGKKKTKKKEKKNE